MKKHLLLLLVLIQSAIVLADASGTCGENVSWSYSSATKLLKLSGSGEMFDYSNGSQKKVPWYSLRNEIESVEVETGITYIGNDAFHNCINLASVSIPISVVAIGRDALTGTYWFDSQPDGIVYAGKVLYKFKGIMPDNPIIDIDEGTLGIADFAFSDCNKLTSISIPNKVIHIGDCSFYCCTNLSSVSFAD